MNFPPMNFLKNASALAGVLVLAGVLLASSAAAQSKTKGLIVLDAGPKADLDHCSNGPLSAPEVCSDVSPLNNWVNGQLGSGKAHYREGESVPYRATITGLTTGATYNLYIEYDVTKGGKYAFDYLTSYDRTENGTGFSAGHAEPCADFISGCSFSSTHDTAPIPDDPLINPPTGQIAGVIDIFGGTIADNSTGVDYSDFTGSIASDSSRFIRVTFVAGGSQVVLAWGAHIATRADWGDNNSAIGITGSPYHVSLSSFTDASGNALSLGQQDHQLSVDAIYFPVVITIVKRVTVPGNPTTFSSTQSFPFTVTPNGVSAGFSLTDSDTTQTGGASKEIQSTTFDTNIDITESIVQGWSLINVSCGAIDPGGNASVGTATPNFPAQKVTLNLKEGNRVTCTFSNSKLITTAAAASISGRVVNTFGGGVSRAMVYVTDAETGSTQMAMTNPFGYYTFDNLDSGRYYIMTVRAKGYKFADNVKSFTLNDSLADMDFVANP